MTRKELSALIQSGNCAVVSYETSRRYRDFIYNEALNEDCEALDRLPHDTYVLVVQCGVNNRPRKGSIIL
jgi:hypothetical protein